MKAIITPLSMENSSSTLPALYVSKSNTVVLFVTGKSGYNIVNGATGTFEDSFLSCFDKTVWTRMPKGTKLELIQD